MPLGRKMVGFRLAAEDLARLDSFAEGLGVSLSEAARMLILEALATRTRKGT